ncbi:MAG TPA: hypothetical protein VGL21_16525 [Jatrophihabitantaceae bacterium]
MSYIKLPVFEDSGYVVLDSYDQSQDPTEWHDIEYVDWKSSGDTRFAPIASAYGDMECNGFWNHNPAKTDKDGVWVPKNAELAPRLKARAEEPGANIGRCRVIELQPNTYADCIYNLHRDDNNRLNPEGTGWVVRGFFNLTDNPDSVMIPREDQDDPSTETRIPLPAGTQVIIDTQRLWHAVWHPGDEPRYCLITSWESGPQLDSYIEKYHPQTKAESKPLDPEFAAKAYEDVAQRKAARAAARAAANGGMDSPVAEVKSEA